MTDFYAPFAKGARVRITKSAPLSGIYIGMLGTVEYAGITAQFERFAGVRMDGDAVLHFPLTSLEVI